MLDGGTARARGISRDEVPDTHIIKKEKKKKKVVQDHFGIEGNKKFMWSQEVESYSLAQLILKAFILVQGLASLNDLFKLKSDWHGD